MLSGVSPCATFHAMLPVSRLIALIGSWMLDQGERADPELDAVAALEASGLPIR